MNCSQTSYIRKIKEAPLLLLGLSAVLLLILVIISLCVGAVRLSPMQIFEV